MKVTLVANLNVTIEKAKGSLLTPSVEVRGQMPVLEEIPSFEVTSSGISDDICKDREKLSRS